MHGNIPHNHTRTSQMAAASKRDSAMSDEQMVADYVFLQGLNGSTCDQAGEALGLPHQGCSARFNALSDTDHGKRPTLLLVGEIRPTRSSRPAQVYVHRRCLDDKTATALEGTMRELEAMRKAKRLAKMQANLSTESLPAAL